MANEGAGERLFGPAVPSLQIAVIVRACIALQRNIIEGGGEGRGWGEEWRGCHGGIEPPRLTALLLFLTREDFAKGCRNDEI